MLQRKPASGDIRVLGLVSANHVIEDISQNVPYGATVTIPASLAVQSKDLWRGISQRCLLQLPSSAPSLQLQQPPVQPVVDHSSHLNEQIKTLNSQVQALMAENQTLRASMASVSVESASKLDSILMMLQNGVSAAPAQAGTRMAPKAAPEEVADGSAPTFLPSQIRPTDMHGHIDIQGESTESNVSSVADRLRKLKKQNA